MRAEKARLELEDKQAEEKRLELERLNSEREKRNKEEWERREREQRKKEEKELREREEQERQRVEKENREKEKFEKEQKERDQRERVQKEKERIELEKLREQQQRQQQQREQAEQELREKIKAQAEQRMKKNEQNYYSRVIQTIKTDILSPIENDTTLKSYCSKARRNIKPRLGQVTNSKTQIQWIIGQLTNTLTDAQNQQSELVYKWSLNFLAKSIVHQAETETIVKPESAYPLGTIAVYMMAKHPLLREFLLARIVKKCPYVIGYTCPTDTEEGRKRMGYKRSAETGSWEEDAAYSERIGGIASVWSVMTQMSFGPTSQLVQRYPIHHAWTFLSRMLNLPSESLTNAHFTVVANWWDLGARRFQEAYGDQATKMLNLACNEWTSSVADKKFPAAARLRILGEQWKQTGVLSIEQPSEP
ncbi:GLE1-like protein-domain-containing protein [Lipomyces oligophaga]|uniref:GLE1-like protein-domain-containing protein n=1 Tax=Lipomyces oligophaga TaxID=45792 RepID=UPI0034CEA160